MKLLSALFTQRGVNCSCVPGLPPDPVNMNASVWILCPRKQPMSLLPQEISIIIIVVAVDDAGVPEQTVA